MNEEKITTNADHISRHDELCEKSKRILNSKDLIQAVKDRFANLSRKGWEWQSFYNGALEGYDIAQSELTRLREENEKMLGLLKECDEYLESTNPVASFIGTGSQLHRRMRGIVFRSAEYLSSLKGETP